MEKCRHCKKEISNNEYKMNDGLCDHHKQIREEQDARWASVAEEWIRNEEPMTPAEFEEYIMGWDVVY